jgi:hypothetical protein
MLVARRFKKGFELRRSDIAGAAPTELEFIWAIPSTKMPLLTELEFNRGNPFYQHAAPSGARIQQG